MSEDKYLDKLSKLLRLAESTTNEAEAQAYMAKAQSLATTMSLSLETARQRQADTEKRQTPIQKRIGLGSAGTKGLKHYVNLFLTIARQNDLKMNIYHDSSGVIAFGFPSDIEVTELLYASLVSQMVDSSERFIRSGAYKSELTGEYKYKNGQYVPKHVDGRVARANFQEAFINTIGTRLALAKMEAVKSVREEEFAQAMATGSTRGQTESSTDLVIRNKEIELADFYKNNTRARGSWKGNTRSSGYSSGARSAGHEAGQSAKLGANRSIGTGPKGITG